MPDFYSDGEYDLSGFAVGIVKKDSVIDGKNITAGDVIIGLPSSGVHSNGFSLVRRVLARSGVSLENQLPGEGITLGEALIAPTVIYVKQVLDIIRKGGVKGIAHITGGGFTDNIPRVFPKGLGAAIYENSWEVPAVFKWIQEAGKIEDAEMRRTFNMGIGMVLIVNKEAARGILEDGHHKAYRIGEVVTNEGVSYKRNGILPMLKRNLSVKLAPPRWQDNAADGLFDVVFTFEEKVFDMVVEDVHTRDHVHMKCVLVINLEVKDNHEEAAIGARLTLDLCQEIKAAESWEDSVDEIIVEFESKHRRKLVYTISYY
ncbi:Phosphoribosylformylglycinamidine cyclo-ligase [Euphorbia peplus]|nr:Phosphoribosylformylglycinamidine cyclo-ligase [Euphorbia peplus]